MWYDEDEVKFLTSMGFSDNFIKAIQKANNKIPTGIFGHLASDVGGANHTATRILTMLDSHAARLRIIDVAIQHGMLDAACVQNVKDRVAGDIYEAMTAAAIFEKNPRDESKSPRRKKKKRRKKDDEDSEDSSDSSDDSTDSEDEKDSWMKVKKFKRKTRQAKMPTIRESLQNTHHISFDQGQLPRASDLQDAYKIIRDNIVPLIPITSQRNENEKSQRYQMEAVEQEEAEDALSKQEMTFFAKMGTKMGLKKGEKSVKYPNGQPRTVLNAIYRLLNGLLLIQEVVGPARRGATGTKVECFPPKTIKYLRELFTKFVEKNESKGLRSGQLIAFYRAVFEELNGFVNEKETWCKNFPDAVEHFRQLEGGFVANFWSEDQRRDIHDGGYKNPSGAAPQYAAATSRGGGGGAGPAPAYATPGGAAPKGKGKNGGKKGLGKGDYGYAGADRAPGKGKGKNAVKDDKPPNPLGMTPPFPGLLIKKSDPQWGHLLSGHAHKSNRCCTFYNSQWACSKKEACYSVSGHTKECMNVLDDKGSVCRELNDGTPHDSEVCLQAIKARFGNSVLPGSIGEHNLLWSGFASRKAAKAAGKGIYFIFNFLLKLTNQSTFF